MSTQKKDSCGFKRVYDANKDMVFKIAMHYSGNNYHMAQDITQEVFEKMLQSFDTYDEEYLIQWLVTVTKNTAINCLKKYRRETLDGDIALTMDLHDEEESVEEFIFEEIFKEEVNKYGRHILDDLYQLNERWYEVVVKVYCMKKKQQDVADELGISIVVLHSVLYRARKWIKEHYKPKDDLL